MVQFIKISIAYLRIFFWARLYPFVLNAAADGSPWRLSLAGEPCFEIF
jgi:hypothetical protein